MGTYAPGVLLMARSRARWRPAGRWASWSSASTSATSTPPGQTPPTAFHPPCHSPTCSSHTHPSPRLSTPSPPPPPVLRPWLPADLLLLLGRLMLPHPQGSGRGAAVPPAPRGVQPPDQAVPVGRGYHLPEPVPALRRRQGPHTSTMGLPEKQCVLRLTRVRACF